MKNLIIVFVSLMILPTVVYGENLENVINNNKAQTIDINKEILIRTYKWLEAGENSVKNSTDFIKEQAPLLCQEIIAYRKFVSATYILINLVFITIGIFLVRQGFKNDLFKNNEPTINLVCSISGALITFSSVCHFAASIASWTQVWFAPRMYLLEYITKLINEN